jgi:hypothetical protein
MKGKLNRTVLRVSFSMAGCLLAMLPAMAAAETWTNVSLIDVNCSSKMAANPDAHTRDCALQCAKSGYGVIAEGKFLKLDADGSAKALALLKAADRKDHLRVNLTGTIAGETISVQSIEMAALAPAGK